MLKESVSLDLTKYHVTNVKSTRQLTVQKKNSKLTELCSPSCTWTLSSFCESFFNDGVPPLKSCWNGLNFDVSRILLRGWFRNRTCRNSHSHTTIPFKNKTFKNILQEVFYKKKKSMQDCRNWRSRKHLIFTIMVNTINRQNFILSQHLSWIKHNV